MRGEDRNQISVNTYNNSAHSYQDKFMEMDLYRNTYDRFCELVDQKYPTILEIACGPGNVSKYLIEKRPDFKIRGIDLAPNMVELARKNVPDGQFELMDCRDIPSLSSKFDAIMCAFCMPYLSKEECSKLISDSAQLLNENGLMYMSTMEGDYKGSGFETTSFSNGAKVFVHYYQKKFIVDNLTNYGFELLNFQTKEYPEPDGSSLTDMIFIAKKK